LRGGEADVAICEVGFYHAGSQYVPSPRLPRPSYVGPRNDNTESPVTTGHSELDIDTLQAILRQASRYIPEEELREWFYTD